MQSLEAVVSASHTLPSWAIVPRALQAHPSPGVYSPVASVGTQLSPGFIHLIYFTVPNVRVRHELAFGFLAVTLVVLPSSKQSNLITALHSCIGKGLCSLTKGFQSTPKCGDIPHGYYVVTSCLSPCREVWLLVEGYEGREGN